MYHLYFILDYVICDICLCEYSCPFLSFHHHGNNNLFYLIAFIIDGFFASLSSYSSLSISVIKIVNLKLIVWDIRIEGYVGIGEREILYYSYVHCTTSLRLSTLSCVKIRYMYYRIYNLTQNGIRYHSSLYVCPAYLPWHYV